MKLENSVEKSAIKLYTDWIKSARPKQLTPTEDFFIWLILAGRGWGKTRTGAQDIALYAMRNPNTICAVVAPTFGDLRRVCFGGESGLVSLIPKECYDSEFGTAGYSSSICEIRLGNGSKIVGYASINVERLRGPQFHRAWCDELASWQYPEAFDQLMFGLRLGDNPKCIITTTPKPIPLLKSLVARDDVYITRGSTFENEENLAPSALAMMKSRYEGTRLGQQELYAEILEDTEGALFNREMIDKNRVPTIPELVKIVVAIDPAVTSHDKSDETGIVVTGRDANGHYYVLDDRSGKYSPDDWIKKAIALYYEYEANYIVAEVNNGGDLIERLIRVSDLKVPYRAIRSSKGKMLRAEPVSSLYEQNKVHHVGCYKELEEQMCQYTGNSVSSPDRLDALVFGITSLMNSGQAVFKIS
tara:strand:+ start:19908 stop:21155 length:1248 start_codon:yes stop_codon:yes gene_type:complete